MPITTTENLMQQHQTAIIYSGGTFGCVGAPLAPLPFLDIQPYIAALATQYGLSHAKILSTQQIKDSSAITPDDWFDLIQLITTCFEDGYQQVILIHGTDTLAYTAALLSEVFRHAPICIMVTGSQHPLLQYKTSTSSITYCVDPTADATTNFELACQTVRKSIMGVFVCFDQQIFVGHHVQKIHTTHTATFAGEVIDMIKIQTALNPPTESHQPPRLNIPLSAETRKRFNDVNIGVLYALPQSLTQQSQKISQLIDSGVDAIVLLGFGAGNFLEAPQTQALFNQAYQKNILLVLSTQVPFGGVHRQYAAGSWLNDVHAISANHAPMTAIYAKLLWVCTTHIDFQARMHSVSFE